MWLLLAFLTATAASGSDIWFSREKLKTVSPLIKALAVSLGALPVILFALAIAGIPSVKPEFWTLVSIEAVLMCAALILYMRELSLGPVSQTQPILALTTVFVLVTNPLMTDNVVTGLGMLGVAMVGVGIYATQHPGRDASGRMAGFFSPFVEMGRQPGVMSKLGVAVIYSVTSNIDYLAMEAASGPFYLAVYSVFVSVLFGILLLTVRIFAKFARFMPLGLIRFMGRIAMTNPIARAPVPAKDLVMGGSIHGASILFHVAAFAYAPVPYVIAVKRLSILFTSFWGYFRRKERPPTWYRMAGTLLVVAGIIVILLFGKG